MLTATRDFPLLPAYGAGSAMAHAATGAHPLKVTGACVDMPVSTGNGAKTTGRVISFADLPDGQEHLVVALGRCGSPVGGVPLVRLHSECLTGDVFGSGRCDCGAQLEESMARIAAVGGYLVYLRQEGRGIGLYAKLDAYRLQDSGMDTFEANRALGYEDDARDYRVAAGMLLALGVARVDLLTGNHQKVVDLVDAGVVVRSVLPTGFHQTAENIRYLDAKRSRGFAFALAEDQRAVERPGGERLETNGGHRDR